MAEHGTRTESSVAAALGGALIRAQSADVGAARERARQGRLRTLALLLGVPAGYLWYRLLTGRPVNLLAPPSLPGDPLLYVIPIAFLLAIGILVAMPLASGRSPHVRIRAEQIDVGLEDVKGLAPIVDDVVRTLNTFLGYARFRDRLGGTPRRGLLFEGPPGTGKTHLARALAGEAGVPFLFVSATAFQSMWYGATARKIRSYFRALRREARREGGAIGFIEEIDAIALTRGGMDTAAASPLTYGMQRNAMMSEGTGGVVNELLIQMQSFDQPPAFQRAVNAVIDWANGYLPAHRQLRRPESRYHNILLIAATNRADRLDPALLRPGRFDRILSFEPPAKAARRELVDHFLDRRSHAPELDEDALRTAIAGQTFGYTPVMIEHLLDEALLHALRDGRDQMSYADIQAARLTEEVGLKQPVAYTEHERRVVATHEAGHATVAYLTGRRTLEVLSIVKRSGSLGLLAHRDPEEVYTRSRSELHALIDIAMGGLVAEEQWFGESSTGPSGDLQAATAIACELVGAAGLEGSLVSLAAIQRGALADTNLVGRVLADPVMRPDVDRILAVSRARVRALIDANRHIVEALRDALLERDELIGQQIVDVARAAGEPVTEGLVVERRRTERRRTDWLEGSDVDAPWMLEHPTT